MKWRQTKISTKYQTLAVYVFIKFDQIYPTFINALSNILPKRTEIFKDFIFLFAYVIMCVVLKYFIFLFMYVILCVDIYTWVKWLQRSKEGIDSQELEFPTESSARKVGALQYDCLHMSWARDTPRDMPKCWERDHMASSLHEGPQTTKNAESSRNSFPWKRVHQLAIQHK